MINIYTPAWGGVLEYIVSCIRYLMGLGP
jgi:hypothetical protein